MIFDDEIWPSVDVNDLWIYDKLILARKMGYVCGPVGMKVPSSSTYIVRPISNFEGMSRGAEFIKLDSETVHLRPGHFWCEVFEGRHLSVDYSGGEQVLCVEGIRRPNKPLYMWDRWIKTEDKVPLPKILNDLPYERINCEFIGGNLIEVHLRHNPDFELGNHSVVFPVWSGESVEPPKGYRYQESPDFERLGFFIPIPPRYFGLWPPR